MHKIKCMGFSPLDVIFLSKLSWKYGFKEKKLTSFKQHKIIMERYRYLEICNKCFFCFNNNIYVYPFKKIRSIQE